MFEDSDDTDSATDHSPLVRQQPSDDDTLHRHTHIITGYLSMFEVVVLVRQDCGLTCSYSSVVGLLDWWDYWSCEV